MTTGHRFPLTLTIALKLRALEHPAAQVRTGDLPSIPRRTALLVRAQNSESRSRSADGRSRRYENGDVSSGANSGSRRTPNRLPPAPPRY
uniref:Uncharacterized protein n=1 Tax=Arundo donax TaxID=35708 RepID=A0A0A9EUW4_ARUDO